MVWPKVQIWSVLVAALKYDYHAKPARDENTSVFYYANQYKFTNTLILCDLNKKRIWWKSHGADKFCSHSVSILLSVL